MFKVVITYGFVDLGPCVDPPPPPVVLHSLSAARAYAQSVVSANYARRCRWGLGTRPTVLKWGSLSFKGFRAYYPDSGWVVYVLPFAW